MGFYSSTLGYQEKRGVDMNHNCSWLQIKRSNEVTRGTPVQRCTIKISVLEIKARRVQYQQNI